MTGRERCLSLLNGGKADRPSAMAVVSVATAESCRALGFSFEQTHLDAGKMTALAAYAHTHLGFDTVMPYFSVVQECAALGAEVHWGSSVTMPHVKGRSLTDPDAFSLPGGFMDRLPIRTVLDSLRSLKAKHGDTAVVLGKAMGPWSLGLRLYGLEELLIDTLDDPLRVHALMQALCAVTKCFVQAQLEAGADMVTIADHTTSNLISPQAYVDFVQPFHKELNALFPGKLILHCCGNTMDRITHFRDGGFPWFHFESANPIDRAMEAAGAMRLIGNINIPDILLQGSEQSVNYAVYQCITQGLSMVSPECAMPLQAPNRNLAQLIKTCQGFPKNSFT